MGELRALEEKIWTLIEKETKNRNTEKVHLLNSMAHDLEKLNMDLKKIQAAVDRVDNNDLHTTNSIPSDSVIIEVTAGSIKQNLLLTTKAKNAQLLPENSGLIEIETSVGQIFQTDELPGHNRLRERGKIKEFYNKAGIKPGDKVILTKKGSNKFFLSKYSQ